MYVALPTNPIQPTPSSPLRQEFTGLEREQSAPPLAGRTDASWSRPQSPTGARRPAHSKYVRAGLEPEIAIGPPGPRACPLTAKLRRPETVPPSLTEGAPMRNRRRTVLRWYRSSEAVRSTNAYALCEASAIGRLALAGPPPPPDSLNDAHTRPSAEAGDPGAPITS